MIPLQNRGRMHGRLKVKTTAQQEKEKAVERAGKLQQYRKAMSAVLARRAAGCRDGEQLKLTAALLLANPDIGTLWNVRREVVTFMSEAEPDQVMRNRTLAGCVDFEFLPRRTPSGRGRWS